MLRPSPNHGTQRLPNDDDDERRVGVRFRRKSVTKVYGSMLLAFRGDALVSNFEGKSVT